MACVDIRTENMDSEREEGEIVDDLDDLSDISSEEEFLLRQRLEILENYNNVLERKEAKRTSIGPGKLSKSKNSFWQDFTKVPINDSESKTQEIYRVTRSEKYLKKTKKPREQSKDVVSLKNNKKKYTRTKKVEPVKLVSESSEDSNDEEYKNKRRKLADAVTLDKNKADTTSLKDRIAKMLNPKQTTPTESFIIENNIILSGHCTKPVKNRTGVILVNNNDENYEHKENIVTDLINDDDVQIVENVEETYDVVDAAVGKTKEMEDRKADSRDNSDDDLESLRQLALNTKTSKSNILPDVQNIAPKKGDSEDEDSDTEELRMICLRSALLKKAIEMKKKQKMQKRLSQHSIVEDDLQNKFDNDINDPENNTDIEYVDMEIGSDVDERSKDGCECDVHFAQVDTDIKKLPKEEEIEEDEDLLRAKLLTSLSKNLPNLVKIETLDTDLVTPDKSKQKTETMRTLKVPEDKKFIITLGDSDSEGEHEATKNLTKMHMKLAEQTEFQQKLDQFLKSTRMEVEKNSLPDVVQPQAPLKPPQKFVPKAMNHLPKSEQIEYRNLVKRMAELEKIKQARQLSLNTLKRPTAKDTLKPHNISADTIESSAKKLEEKIAASRKMIAEVSAKMLKLKEEATKLSQRYKIVSNELRNITTAVTLNKKQQRAVQNGLSKIRLQHQILLKSSMALKHSTVTHTFSSMNRNKDLNINKKQKENNPSVKEQKIPNNVLKAVKVSVINDLNKDTSANDSRLSVEVDIASNKKVVKTKTPTKERIVDFNESEAIGEDSETNKPSVEKGGGIEENKKQSRCDITDYISPLDALGRTEQIRIRITIDDRKVDGTCLRTSQTGAAIWQEDPNAFLCPFEVGGSCRDTDCKFLHLQK